MADYMVNFRTTTLSADREVQRAIDIINSAIKSGSLVYLYELDNVNYSIKLRNPIGIAMVDMPNIEVKDNGYYLLPNQAELHNLLLHSSYRQKHLPM